MLEQLDAPTLEQLATEIPGLRRQYLIGRVLSKSQTALTRLAELRQSQLNLTTDLHTGYTLQLEIPVGKKRFSVIEHRRKLRSIFNGDGAYRLHPLNGEFVEKHLNMAKGIRDGIVWTLDSVDLFVGQPPLREQDEEFLIIKTPHQNKFVVRSAQELRERFPKNGFEKCWNEAVDVGGYTIRSRISGRVYLVSYGRRNIGSIHEDNITQDEVAHYLSIEYLGLEPDRVGTSRFGMPLDVQQGFFERIFSRRPVPPIFSQLMQTESQVIAEMKILARHCKEKLEIP